MKKSFKLIATGDALFTADVPNEYFSGDFKKIQAFMADADIKMTNLETNVSEFGEFPNQYSGGTWLNVTPNEFDDLVKFGFDYYSTANNHCMDYSYHGLLSTIEELDKRGLKHSGTGRSLQDAAAPAILNFNGGSVGIIAVDTSFKEPSKAGVETKTMKSRPGVNYVGFEQYFPIDLVQLEQLKNIAAASKVNAYNDLLTADGFSLKAENGVYQFGNTKFCYDGSKKKTECNKKDKARLIDSIEQAKKVYDYVVLAVHCHEIGDTKHEEVPEFLSELAKSAVDAGANAVICNGTHQLRPLEIYKDSPIFYSLGDFIYQGMRVKYLPADFMTKYGIDVNSTAYEGLMARSDGGKKGLQTKRCNFLTVLPKMTFNSGKLQSLEMLPVVAGFKREGKMDGLPYVAEGDEAIEIFNILKELSAPYGTELKLENGIIVLK